MSTSTQALNSPASLPRRQKRTRRDLRTRPSRTKSAKQAAQDYKDAWAAPHGPCSANLSITSQPHLRARHATGSTRAPSQVSGPSITTHQAGNQGPPLIGPSAPSSSTFYPIQSSSPPGKQAHMTAFPMETVEQHYRGPHVHAVPQSFQHYTGPHVHAVPQSFQSPNRSSSRPEPRRALPAQPYQETGDARTIQLCTPSGPGSSDHAAGSTNYSPCASTTSHNSENQGSPPRSELPSAYGAARPDPALISLSVDAFMQQDRTYLVFEVPPKSDILQLRMAAIARLSEDANQATEWFDLSCKLDMPDSWNEEAKAHALAIIWSMEAGRRDIAAKYLMTIDFSGGLQHNAGEEYAALLLLSELMIDLLGELPLQLPEPAPHCDTTLSHRYWKIKEMLDESERRVKIDRCFENSWPRTDLGVYQKTLYEMDRENKRRASRQIEKGFEYGKKHTE